MSTHCIHLFPRTILAHAGDPATGRHAAICTQCGLGSIPAAPDTWKPLGEDFPDGARFQFAAIGESDEPVGPAPSIVRYVMNETAYGRTVRMRDPIRCF